MKNIVFVTSHAQKAEELSLYLKRPVTHHKIDLVEIQSLDPHEVARSKAEEAYKQMKTPCPEGVLLHVIHYDGLVLFVVFAVGYINCLAAGYFAWYMLHHRKELLARQ